MPRHGPSEAELDELTALTDKAERAATLAATVGAPEAIADFQEVRAQKTEARLAEAVALRMAGLTYTQIAARLHMNRQNVAALLHRADVETPKIGVDQMRELENSRLDRAQAAIWSKVLEGDHRALDMFLRISSRRAALNGLNAAVRIDLAVSVRQEMEAALSELQNVVLGEVISREDDRDTDRP